MAVEIRQQVVFVQGKRVMIPAQTVEIGEARADDLGRGAIWYDNYSKRGEAQAIALAMAVYYVRFGAWPPQILRHPGEARYLIMPIRGHGHLRG
jgi:hypothetical protein